MIAHCFFNCVPNCGNRYSAEQLIMLIFKSFVGCKRTHIVIQYSYIIKNPHSLINKITALLYQPFTLLSSTPLCPVRPVWTPLVGRPVGARAKQSEPSRGGSFTVTIRCVKYVWASGPHENIQHTLVYLDGRYGIYMNVSGWRKWEIVTANQLFQLIVPHWRQHIAGANGDGWPGPQEIQRNESHPTNLKHPLNASK